MDALWSLASASSLTLGLDVFTLSYMAVKIRERLIKYGKTFYRLGFSHEVHNNR